MNRTNLKFIRACHFWRVLVQSPSLSAFYWSAVFWRENCRGMSSNPCPTLTESQVLGKIYSEGLLLPCKMQKGESIINLVLSRLRPISRKSYKPASTEEWLEV